MDLSPSLMNHERARQLLRREALDGIIAASAVNVTYACGFHSPSPHVFPDMQVFGLVPPDTEDITLVIPRDELTYVGVSPASVEDIRVYGETTLQWSDEASYDAIETRVRRLMTTRPRHAGPVEALASAIADRGLQQARLGIDERGILPANLAHLRRLLPEAELVDASDLWRLIRAVKTPLELERLRRASQINEEALAASIGISGVGTTQADLYNAYQARVIERGAFLHYWGGGVGTQSALFGPPIPNHQGRPGDVIRIDGAMTHHFYWADTGRTVVLGQVTERQKTYYAALHEGLYAGLALVRPGVHPSQIFDAIVETVQQAGISHYFRFHCGHGLGLDFYEVPSLRPAAGDAEEIRLEEGMVLNIEVPYYELGFGGMQIEDTLLVTAGGYEFITEQSRELVVKPGG